MAKPPPTSTQSPAPKEKDFIQAHGKYIVVIIFCILSGNALPAIIQNASDPDKPFLAIILVTLPYTAAMAIVSLILGGWVLGVVKDGFKFNETIAIFGLCGLIFFGFFWLASLVHWGMNDVEIAMVNQQIDKANHTNFRVRFIGYGIILIQFYFNKYGYPLFIAATLASLVIAWDIKKWIDARWS